MNQGVVTFGEVMLRLAPYHYESFLQAEKLQMTFGGAESNVAVSLARYGHDVTFVSAVPDNLMGEAALNSLRKFGVDTRHVLRSGDRLGIYFLEHGASIRPSRVIYDRSGSAVSAIDPKQLDWPLLLRGKRWFHTTGITAALSQASAEAALQAVRTAKEMGLSVSCDLNYRKKLWSRQDARIVMSELVRYVDVVIANEEDCADVFGIEADKTDVTTGKLDPEHYKSVAAQVRELSGAKFVAITLRESLSASDNNWSAMIDDGTQSLFSRKYPVHIVDRVGGGDSFGAGLIHGFLSNWDSQKTLDFAVAASALKQTLPGDVNLVSENDVLNVMKGDISGRVQR